MRNSWTPSEDLQSPPRCHTLVDDLMKIPEDINEAANALAESLDAAVFVYSGAIDEMGFGGLLNPNVSIE